MPIEWADAFTIAKKCGANYWQYIGGCADTSRAKDGYCPIILRAPDVIEEDMIALEYLHERAHCNGSPDERGPQEGAVQ